MLSIQIKFILSIQEQQAITERLLNLLTNVDTRYKLYIAYRIYVITYVLT